jgi:protein SCO1/2
MTWDRQISVRPAPAALSFVAALLFLLGPAAAVRAEPEPAHDPHAHHHNTAPASTTERSTADYAIPDLGMLDQRGERIALPDLFDTDRPVMVNFVFTTCTAICPMMTSIFQQVQKRLGDDAEKVLMVSVSIDPEHDSPKALAEYAARFHAGPQWYFLTGTLEDSIAVQKAFDAYRGDKMNHAPLTLLRGSRGSAWVRLDGFASAEELERECRAMLGT